jgi:uncharacterized protein
MLQYETRSLAEPPEIRSADGGRLVASGVAIRYGARSKPILGRFVEEIRSGAATKTMSERDVLALHEHERSMMLGRTSSGTLRLIDSATELRYEIDLPDTSVGRDVAHLLERGDLKGSSFGFRANPKMVSWSVDKGMAVRSVGEMALLHHIATTVDPAYNETNAEIAYRSLADATQLDLRTVIEAAERGELAPIEEVEEERSAVPFRRPAHWFV